MQPAVINLVRDFASSTGRGMRGLLTSFPTNIKMIRYAERPHSELGVCIKIQCFTASL